MIEIYRNEESTLRFCLQTEWTISVNRPATWGFFQWLVPGNHRFAALAGQSSFEGRHLQRGPKIHRPLGVGKGTDPKPEALWSSVKLEFHHLSTIKNIATRNKTRDYSCHKDMEAVHRPGCKSRREWRWLETKKPEIILNRPNRNSWNFESFKSWYHPVNNVGYGNSLKFHGFTRNIM